MLPGKSKSFLALRSHFIDKAQSEDEKENDQLSRSMRERSRKLKQSITNSPSRLAPKDIIPKHALKPTTPKPLVPKKKHPRVMLAAAATSPKTKQPLLPKAPLSPPPQVVPTVLTAPTAPTTPAAPPPPVVPASPIASATPTVPAPTTPTARTTFVQITPTAQTTAPTTREPYRTVLAEARTGFTTVAASCVSSASPRRPTNIPPVIPSPQPTSSLTTMIYSLLDRIAAGETINYKLRNPQGYHDDDPECLHFLDEDSDSDNTPPSSSGHPPHAQNARATSPQKR
ncbi:hypothetical protein DRE_01870 [Drechslerella stenobrocha 248]|uniref:Uncharacterized protein n=1 Tax=Drechslerella stenobrocha 248 TaxID=1043628 RepID=W7I8L4_9PEZI|nr:hypothetical protein DRE_01870 [Drechslerella stenobrocha 248]